MNIEKIAWGFVREGRSLVDAAFATMGFVRIEAGLKTALPALTKRPPRIEIAPGFVWPPDEWPDDSLAIGKLQIMRVGKDACPWVEYPDRYEVGLALAQVCRVRPDMTGQVKDNLHRATRWLRGARALQVDQVKEMLHEQSPYIYRIREEVDLAKREALRLDRKPYPLHEDVGPEDVIALRLRTLLSLDRIPEGQEQVTITENVVWPAPESHRWVLVKGLACSVDVDLDHAVRQILEDCRGEPRAVVEVIDRIDSILSAARRMKG